MSIWRPDPRFTLRPRWPWMRRRKSWRTSRWSTERQRPSRRNGRRGRRSGSPPATAISSARWTCRNAGDELHHFGWNACSACLCPHAPHPHVERRYLVVPGINSSRIHVIDTKPDPRKPQIVKVIEPETLAARTGYASPHTVHCGPDGILMSALGAPGGDGPGGVFVMDHESFDVLGKWELDRGPQKLAYDFWWHLGFDTLDYQRMGNAQHGEQGSESGDSAGRRLRPQAARLGSAQAASSAGARFGSEQQMALELRPAHDPTRAYGFLGVVVSLKDLSASVWLWHRDDDGKWAIQKVIEIPAEPADPALLPPLLQGFKAVPPLVTDINLSLDDRFLYVSCFGHRRVPAV